MRTWSLLVCGMCWLLTQGCTERGPRYVYFVSDNGKIVKMDYHRDKVVASFDLEGRPQTGFGPRIYHVFQFPGQNRILTLAKQESPDGPDSEMLLEYELTSGRLLGKSSQLLPEMENPRFFLSANGKAVAIQEAKATKPEFVYDVSGSELKRIPPSDIAFPDSVPTRELDRFVSQLEPMLRGTGIFLEEDGKRKIAHVLTDVRGDTRLYLIEQLDMDLRRTDFAVITGHNPGHLTVVRGAPFSRGEHLQLSSDGRSVMLQEVGPWITEPELRSPRATGRILGYASLTGKKLFDTRIPQPYGMDPSEFRFKCMTPDQVVFFDAGDQLAIVHGQTGEKKLLPWINGPCMFLDK